MRRIFSSLLLPLLLLPFGIAAQDTQVDDECYNCRTYLWQNTQWCWGENPAESQSHWEQFRQLTAMQQELQEYDTGLIEAIAAEIDWLSANCPCLHPALYTQSLSFYTTIIHKTKKRKERKLYQQKITQLEQLQMHYFGREVSASGSSEQ